MKLPQLIPVLGAFALLFALHAGAQGALVRPQPAPPGTSASGQPTPEQTAKVLVQALHIENFKLLSSGTGWASTGSKLLRTTDNGAHWKDISPPNPKHDDYASVFFHDADTGWVLFDHEIQEGENPTPKSVENNEVLYFSATTDGGSTWTNEDLPVWEGQAGYSGSVIITFADKLHGWISLNNANLLFPASTTYSSADGGKTWKMAEYGNDGDVQGILAVTDKDIWMVGRGGDASSSQFGVSHDGGESFQAVVLPAPKEFSSFGYPEYALPVFTDSHNGYVAVTYSDSVASKSVAVLYATADGGRSWKQDRLLSNLAEEETVESTVAGSVWILPFAPPGQQQTLVKLLSGDKTAATAHKSSGDFNNCKLSFLTASDGWMNCSGSLSSTIDGGATWTAITPRHRNGVLTTDPVTPVPAPILRKTHPIQVSSPKPLPSAANATPAGGGLASGIDQHLGFDISEYMSPAVMQIWWDSSPYYDAIYYVPGAPSHGGDSRINAAWVSAITAQGWGLIPTWVGYQSYSACRNGATYPACTRYPNQISPIPGTMEAQTACTKIVQVKGKYDPLKDTAWNQGICQADAAIAKLKSLGFDGMIAYLDVEGFVPSALQTVNGKNYSCSGSVQAYVAGWVQEMHAQGALAGVYGSASNVTEAFGPENPDEIWIAGGKTGVTVWNEGYNIDDKSWPNKQRIHQYKVPTKKDPNIQIWGTKKFQIDNDIVDAAIVPSAGTKEYPLIGEAPFSAGSNGEWLLAIANGKDNASGLKLGEGVGMYNLSDSAACPPYVPSNPEGVFTYLGGATTAMFSYGGAAETIPSGINNLGQIVGSYSVFSGENCNGTGGGFYTTASNPTTPIAVNDYQGSAVTVLTGINDAGWIVGNYMDVDASGVETGHCALWKPPYTTPQPFDLPGAQGSACYGINGLGQIVGGAPNSEGAFTPFVDDAEAGDPNAPANFSTISAPDGATVGNVSGINNNGQILGFYIELDASSAGPFILNDSQFVIWPPDASSGQVSSINDDLQMAAGNAILYGLPIQP